MKRTLQLNPKDNVVTCLQAVTTGARIEMEEKIVIAATNIPRFHKMAAVPIERGAYCYKYGEIIGVATRDVLPGEHVHVHNIESTRGCGYKQKKEEHRP